MLVLLFPSFPRIKVVCVFWRWWYWNHLCRLFMSLGFVWRISSQPLNALWNWWGRGGGGTGHYNQRLKLASEHEVILCSNQAEQLSGWILFKKLSRSSCHERAPRILRVVSAGRMIVMHAQPFPDAVRLTRSASVMGGQLLSFVYVSESTFNVIFFCMISLSNQLYQ